MKKTYSNFLDLSLAPPELSPLETKLPNHKTFTLQHDASPYDGFALQTTESVAPTIRGLARGSRGAPWSE